MRARFSSFPPPKPSRRRARLSSDDLIHTEAVAELNEAASFYAERAPKELGLMQMPAAAGYSATPLAKKLGIKASSHVLPVGAPDGYVALLGPLPAGVAFEQIASPRVDIAHIFVTRKEELAEHLSALRTKLKPEAALWVSWPKKASKVPTTVTEDIIREIALPLGFVDVKVCAVSEVWSGLKLVVRKELR